MYSPYLLVAVIFGLGIPTGYGSIAPLGGDAKDKKAIGKAAIAVVIYGGLLATFFFYSLGSLNFTGNLIVYLITHFGILGLIIVPVIALSYGVLGGILKIINKYIRVDYIDETVKFSIDNELWIGMPKNNLNDIIMEIDPVYVKMDDKVKFLFLLSLIREEFLKIQMKLEILKSNAKMYIKKNAMEFSGIHLMAKALNVIKDAQKTSSSLNITLKDMGKLNDIIVDINNYNIKHSIAGYVPEMIFLNALLINQIFVFGLVMSIDLNPSLISYDSLPQFSAKTE